MLECDYLVIGSGATGMAFVDELFHSTKDTTFIIVDKHHKPGGHWNDAYEFVTLHQPAQFYGVRSKILGKGNNDLASFNEIRAYYEDVMEELTSSGRVRYFPQCEYQGNNVFRSLIQCGLEYTVHVRKKTVDGTYVGPSVPSTRSPEYEVANGAHVVPVNGIAMTKEAWERYVVVGGGKTGIDAVLYMLKNNVTPDRIFWIIPNDYWLFNRNFLFGENMWKMLDGFFTCVVESTSYKELIQKWDNCGLIMRIDTSIEPKRFKAGTVTTEELEKLRLVKNVIRQGRVGRIEQHRIVFQNGTEIPTTPKTLHIDCTGNGANPFTPKPIFDGSKITLQNLRLFQPCYSGCLIGAFEARYPEDEERKNRVLTPITHPHNLESYVKLFKQDILNDMGVEKELGLLWMRGNRLDMSYHISLFQYAGLVYFAYNSIPKMLLSLEHPV